MGLNVVLYAEGVVTPREKIRVNELFAERLPGFLQESEPGEYSFSREAGERMGYWAEDRWFAYTWARYYGPGYERGDWPRIAAAIELLRHALPDRDICYGSDGNSVPELVDDETMRELWAHWASDEGQHYWDDAKRRGRVL